VKDQHIFMTPQGVLTGIVADEDNEPMANATVEAFSYRTALQENRARIAGSARTDDQGRYRIFGISPGRYYISARTQAISGIARATTKEEQQAGYVPTYYPGTNHASAGVPVQVTSGQETKADITMIKLPTVHASGKLVTRYRVRGARIIAYPGDHPSWDPGDRRATDVDDKTGVWTIDGLQPGPYTFVIDRVYDGVRLGARLNVNIGTKNIDNLELPLIPYPDLVGKVAVEGNGPLPPGITVSLQPRQALASMGYASGQVNSDGGFDLNAISPDLSDVTLSNVPSGYFLKSVTFSGHEVSQSGIELGFGTTRPIAIVISHKGGTVEGSVSDEQGRPFAHATVVLIPDSEQRKLKSRYYTATSDQNGHFILSGIRPGEYTAAAWDSVDSIDYTDAEALEIADNRGQSLKVDTIVQPAVELKVIPSAELIP
jgi:protocatechuate 3,4-dioxygenase beta subunit